MDTIFQNGSATLQNTYDASGNLLETRTWSASGEVDKLYKNGKLVEQDSWDASGVNAETITWSANGTKVETFFRNGTAYLRETWAPSGDFTQETWSGVPAIPKACGTRPAG